MLVGLIIFLILAALFMYATIKNFSVISADYPLNYTDHYLCLGVMVICLLFSHFHACDLGGGVLRKDSGYFFLARGAIYTVVSSAPIGDGKFAVILKFKNGKIRAYELAQDPPKVFVAVDDEKNPYVPYPVK